METHLPRVVSQRPRHSPENEQDAPSGCKLTQVLVEKLHPVPGVHPPSTPAQEPPRGIGVAHLELAQSSPFWHSLE